MMFTRIYAVANTQIFNFNHSVDVVVMRNVSKDKAFGDWYQAGRGRDILTMPHCVLACITSCWDVDDYKMITRPRLNKAKKLSV